jgi:hypothetical protein
MTETDRQYIYPFDAMFCAYPPAYLAPEQSRYHNIGMNGYVKGYPPYSYNLGTNKPYINTIYPDKRPGSIGDYGPHQENDVSRNSSAMKHLPYQLDTTTVYFNENNNYRMKEFVRPQYMSIQSAELVNAGLNSCDNFART